MKQRSSNLELYRILCMLLIVAHHYVVNSGVASLDGPLTNEFTSANSIFFILFGAWGKTGINCFMMITGYFMCTSRISFRKFLKLMGQIYLYRWVFYAVFLLTGYETFTLQRLIKLVMPFWNITDDFTSCFIVFWLTIPFWTILVQKMKQRQHQLLLILMLGIYTILGSVPTFQVSFNYVTWFGIIFLISSYIRLYPHLIFENKKFWGRLSLVSFSFAVLSVLLMNKLYGSKGIISYSYYFVSDSNKFLSVAIATCTFLWFKNINIKYSKLINSFGAATFGVLLIHANSDAMRTWLWKDTIDVVGHYSLPLVSMISYSIGVVLAIFVICNLVDQVRIFTLEKWFFKWYDNKLSVKADKCVAWLTNDR